MSNVQDNAAPGIYHGNLISSLQSMRDRMMAVLVPKFGEAFDGDFDAMLEAINALKRIDTSPNGGTNALSRAYGYLWHVNHPEDIPAGHPFMSSDRAAVEARKELRDMLTHQQRGEGINWVRQKLLVDMHATSPEATLNEQFGSAEGLGDLPGMWEKADLVGGATDSEDGPKGGRKAPKDGEVLVMVSGLTGSGKSAVAGEIEILCKALGLEVEWADSEEEKRLTHADWTEALELYKPRVRIVEVNIPRAQAGDAEVQP